jgi:hypothetical protein
VHTVLVLGGYGFFGARIAAELAKTGASRVLIAGRDLERARHVAKSLGLRARSALQLDATGANLAETFGARGVSTVIHAAGPFQAQGYGVAAAAILAGANYIDLADGRAFVAGIASLDGAARGCRVTVVSGASPVPALSAAVVDQYLPAFSRLDSIHTGIGPGARAPGLATVQGIFGGVDVPDLELFPARYPGVKTVTFHAGFAISRWLEALISGKGGMFVVLEGLGRDGQPLTKRWHLLAERNHGPFVPCGAALALAGKLAAGEPVPRGAMPCVGLLSVAEYLAPLKSLAITIESDPV